MDKGVLYFLNMPTSQAINDAQLSNDPSLFPRNLNELKNYLPCGLGRAL